MRIDVRGSDALQDVILALKSSDAETRRAIRSFTKARLTRPWLEEIDRESTTKQEKRVISATATVAVGDQNIRIQSAAKGRKLSGGLDPKVHYAGVEFGALHGKYQKASKPYTRTYKGGQPHRVLRNTSAQFRGRRKAGYAFYPAAQEMIPRLASLWVQTVVKTYADIFEGKR